MSFGAIGFHVCERCGTIHKTIGGYLKCCQPEEEKMTITTTEPMTYEELVEQAGLARNCPGCAGTGDVFKGKSTLLPGVKCPQCGTTGKFYPPLEEILSMLPWPWQMSRLHPQHDEVRVIFSPDEHPLEEVHSDPRMAALKLWLRIRAAA